MNEREAARRATIISFRNRVIGNMNIGGAKVGYAEIRYTGKFPYLDVAGSVDLPRAFSEQEIGLGTQRTGSAHRAGVHSESWRHLFNAFDRAWRDFDQTRAA